MHWMIFSALTLFAAPLAAHPHIFINTGLVFSVDDRNRLTHVQITWEYDEFFSLLMTEDLGVDADYDGVLTEADLELLAGFDMNWIEGYNGDLVGEQSGVALTLSPPTQPTATMEDGKIITTHVRYVLDAPALDAPVVFRPYDASYYTAYEVRRPVRVQGSTGCDITLNEPDIAGALAMLQAELSAMPYDYDMEAAGLGNIGGRFATEVRLTCAAS